MSARVPSTIAFRACSCAETPNLSSMPQLLRFDIKANKLGYIPMLSTLFDLSGRTALVTGGSKGLGKAMARTLAEAGASVAISSRHEDELKSAAAEIGQESHAKVVPLAADMTHRGEVKRLAERAIAALGKVDILINNAGGNVPQPIDQITDEIWDHFVELNLSSCMALTRALVPQMKDRKWGPRHSHFVNHGLHFDPRAQRLLRYQKRPLGLGPRERPGSGPVWHYGQLHRTRTLLNRTHTDEFHGRSAPEICR